MLNAEPTDAREIFAVEVQRTAKRLRSMSLDKLSQGNRVADTRKVVGNIAQYGLARIGQSQHDVPGLTPAALADQLVVVARLLNDVESDSDLTAFSESLRTLRATL